MHELSIAFSIVDGVLEEAERRGTPPIHAVHLRLGRLSGVDKEALLFSYGVACQDTVLAASHLVIEEVEVRIYCAACATDRAVRDFPRLICAECGTPAERLLNGEELEVSALELEA